MKIMDRDINGVITCFQNWGLGRACYLKGLARALRELENVRKNNPSSVGCQLAEFAIRDLIRRIKKERETP